jgi:hypothetical protein
VVNGLIELEIVEDGGTVGMEKEIEISLYIASIRVARRSYRGYAAGLCCLS